MAAIFSLGQVVPVERGQPVARRAGRAQHTRRGRDEIDVHVVRRPIGIVPAGCDLHVVHRRHDDGVVVDQPGRGGERELEVAEAAALAEPGTVLPHRDAPGHDEIDSGVIASKAIVRAERAASLIDAARARADRRAGRDRARRTDRLRRAAARPCRRACRPSARGRAPAAAANRGSTSPCPPRCHSSVLGEQLARPAPRRRSSGSGCRDRESG